jgi:hypothetical protein
MHRILFIDKQPIERLLSIACSSLSIFSSRTSTLLLRLFEILTLACWAPFSSAWFIAHLPDYIFPVLSFSKKL